MLVVVVVITNDVVHKEVLVVWTSIGRNPVEQLALLKESEVELVYRGEFLDLVKWDRTQ